MPGQSEEPDEFWRGFILAMLVSVVLWAVIVAALI